jgi:hypothetical protein
VACWGVAGHVLALAMTFLALAALWRKGSWRGWLRVVLAGMAVGMALAEGADMGAIFSLCVVAFVGYQAWISPGVRPRNLVVGVCRLGLVVIFAVFLAAYAITALVQTQVEGVSGMQQDEQTRDQRWNWATQWSLPKAEALSVAVPGLFGYRLDTPDGGNYWGSIGRDHKWTEYFAGGRVGPKPSGFARQTGGGIYAGITVLLVAAWAVVQAFRRRDSAFTPGQRRWLWFWMCVAGISLLLGFGRHAPFYRILYAMPFSSTVRNPVKFLAIVNFAIVILFTWGVDGLWRKYMLATRAVPSGVWTALKARWSAPGPEKKWMAACLMVFAGSLAAWGLYALSSDSLRDYLQGANFNEKGVYEISAFSIRQVGWFVLFFLLGAGLIACVLSGVFSGPRAKWGVFLLGLFVCLDLGRANLPWILSVNYREKYAANPVIDFLRQKPYEQRVILSPFKGPPAYEQLRKIYRIEWAQHPFQYYDIQSSEIVQMPRVPEDMQAFHDALFFDGSLPNIYRLFRRWELTNTRYLVDLAGSADAANLKFDPIQHRFREVFRFNIVSNGLPSMPGQIDNQTVQLDTNGEYSVVEFTGYLPRARLYSNWQVNADDAAVLGRLANPAFDPKTSVIVDAGLPAGTKPPSATNQDAGTVEITSYSSRDVQLKANAATPAVLLLNDKYDPTWRVFVDGREAPLLRCNFLVRGVYLQPGSHKVEFSFRPQAKLLRVSIAAIGIGLALLVVLMIAGIVQPQSVTAIPSPEPSPAPAPAPVRQPLQASQVKPKNGGKKQNGKKRPDARSKV